LPHHRCNRSELQETEHSNEQRQQGHSAAAAEQRKHNVNTTLKRIIAGALLSGGLVSAGLGLAAGTAEASPSPTEP
jgi:hypothetical protein